MRPAVQQCYISQATAIRPAKMQAVSTMHTVSWGLLGSERNDISISFRKYSVPNLCKHRLLLMFELTAVIFAEQSAAWRL